MAEYRIRKLTEPSEAELDVLVRICEFGARGAPVQRIGFSDPATAPLIFDFYRAMLKAIAAYGVLFVAYDPTKESEPKEGIIGCVTCIGPGRELLGDPEQWALGFNTFLASLPPGKMEIFLGYLKRYGDLADTLIGPGVKRASWGLNSLNVVPGRRGKGIGRALIEAAEDLAKKDGVPVIFETDSEHNTALYQHWGYQVVGQDEMESDGGDKVLLKVFRKDFTPQA